MSDEAEFTGFVHAYSAALLRLAFYLTADRGLAEDLLQVTLTKTFLAWHRIHDREAVHAYARRTMVRTATAWWRRRSWHGEQAHDVVPDTATTDRYGEIDERARVLAAVRRLPARQRAVVALRFLEDYSEAETARLLGCSPGTVKSHSARALKQLRRTLADPVSMLELVEEGR
ncbi:SigE family RNA polymerase sigma factor [Kribbella deserti]|uniref:SigE family RNA polymerase sigma factor n=1 Tax=Kribbella deserti TaxID=1926257 RepID=A0ABV6QH39_9ACTN